MTCDDCIHKSVCYRRIESVSTSYADKCGDFMSEQEPKSEWEHDHEILKAYSNGANEVLDKITVEIEQVAEEESKFNIKGARGLKHALKIINKYKTEMEENKDEKR